ncbi:DUF4442 domain-containing protein [Dactylosporangium sp. AC04546]|uniref:DUF4442 domain-containing protein n=1 Tax=Dactylosporangium sp. AC04546 TaxID=2862460 RepID=UPI001EDCED0B|nr:DUF4442 domain-containing protein [Dactylosporangium sp. AC04546]WVK78299.1 DUF4442 domain-containing protein [Dactylosporangium sp. AC04546]
MDTTALARSLLEPIPANRTAGVEVLRAADGAAEVAATVPAALTNVIGSLHASGLAALADAAGLAAVIAACTGPSDFTGVVPLGASATLRFLAPARGRLTATCVLDAAARAALAELFASRTDRARLTTTAVITDESGTTVCEGTFDWRVRRT